MYLPKAIIKTLKKNGLLKKILASESFIKYILPLGLFDRIYLNSALDEEWKVRIQDVMECPDNKLIERHPKAGMVKHGKQFMHNGIVTTLGGYYGDEVAQLLFLNKGVHEPQEEYAFDLVLKDIGSGGTMIELGSYWAFYSIWFNKKIKNAKNFLIEPGKLNMFFGINNFRLNQVKGKFTQSLVGKTSGFHEGIPITCIDDFVEENKIEFIDILHSDIQGFEYDMLLGASKTIANHKIRYVFISTHGNQVHYKCLGFLKENSFSIVCSADENETYSLDGLIVAKSDYFAGLDNIKISLKDKHKLDTAVSTMQCTNITHE